MVERHLPRPSAGELASEPHALQALQPAAAGAPGWLPFGDIWPLPPDALPAARDRAAPLPAGRLIAAVLALALLLLCAVTLATLLLPPLWPNWPERLPLPAQQALAQVTPEPAWPALSAGPWMERVREHGVLVAAVRYYRRPAPPEAPTPAEPDNFDATLARVIAQRLGVRLELVDGGSIAAPESPHGGADLRIAGSVPADLGHRSNWRVPTVYTGGAGQLVTLRSGPLQQPADLHAATVCVQQGSPYAEVLAHRWQASLQTYPSGVHAVYAFMSGECQALADDELLVERLLTRDEWRFYRVLPGSIEPDNQTPQLVLEQGDAASTRFLDQTLRYWKIGGALLDARERRVGDITFEATQLQDGLICHA